MAAQVADRIGAEPLRRQAFLGQRQHLPQQGIMRIARPHARDEPARHAQREQPGRGLRRRQPFLAQPHRGQQFGGLGDGAGQLRLPRGDLP